MSYFQGGQVITFIAEKWGYDKVLAMIHDFADKKDTVEVIEQELKLKPEEFDAQFFPWIEAKYKKQVDGFDDWQKQLQAGLAGRQGKAVGRGDQARARRFATSIRITSRPGTCTNFWRRRTSPRTTRPRRWRSWSDIPSVGGRSPGDAEAAGRLAERKPGKKREAAATLERLNLIYLEDEAAHQKLGKLYMDLKNPNGAIREYQAVLAGGTIDQAGAHFGLAQAFQAANRPEEALR